MDSPWTVLDGPRIILELNFDNFSQFTFTETGIRRMESPCPHGTCVSSLALLGALSMDSLFTLWTKTSSHQDLLAESQQPRQVQASHEGHPPEECSHPRCHWRVLGTRARRSPCPGQACTKTRRRVATGYAPPWLSRTVDITTQTTHRAPQHFGTYN